MKKVLIRFDDICPTMDFYQWDRACQIMDKYSIKPLIGVIPDCKDPDLLISEPHPDFWDNIKSLQQKGYTVAMHGLYHVYDTSQRGIVNHSWHSEFAGHTFEEQVETIRKGKEILSSHGIETDIFFAPAHSYDMNTIKALAANGFSYLSDGGMLKPTNVSGVLCLPCHFSGARLPVKMEYDTIVFHAHEWAKDKDDKEYKLLKKICEDCNTRIISFEQFSNAPIGNTRIQLFNEKLYVWYDRHVWPLVVKLYAKFIKR